MYFIFEVLLKSHHMYTFDDTANLTLKLTNKFFFSFKNVATWRLECGST